MVPGGAARGNEWQGAGLHISPGLTESELAESLTVPAIREQAREMYKIAMPEQAIAEAIAYALTQPDSVAVNEIIVRPLAAQNF